jgi:L-rhamnose mutarotase
METIGFTMILKPGKEAEYKKRHDEIWPELVKSLRQAGVSDYSIFFDDSTGRLFATLRRTENHEMEQLPSDPIVQKWWRFMADIMETEPDNAPKSNPLELVFHME